METLEISKANWSGESTKIKIDEKGHRVKVYGEWFELEKTESDSFETHEQYNVINDCWSEPVAKVMKLHGKYYASSNGSCRESENIYIAIAQLLFTII